MSARGFVGHFPDEAAADKESRVVVGGPERTNRLDTLRQRGARFGFGRPRSRLRPSTPQVYNSAIFIRPSESRARVAILQKAWLSRSIPFVLVRD